MGRPLRFLLTAGQASDARHALALIDGLKAAHVLADKAYDSHALLNHIEAIGARPIIPKRTCMPRERAFDSEIYKHRNQNKHTNRHHKQLRRIATRYDRRPENYLAGLYLASIPFWC